MDYLLFGLRILLVIALYAFLGLVLFFLIRETRSATQAVTTTAAPIAATLIELPANTTDSSRPARTYKLVADAWIGRDPNCLIRVNDTFASAQHAHIMWVNQTAAWWIEDKSLNGTLINGARIVRAMLNDDDVIRIGDAAYQFKLA